MLQKCQQNYLAPQKRGWWTTRCLRTGGWSCGGKTTQQDAADRGRTVCNRWWVRRSEMMSDASLGEGLFCSVLYSCVCRCWPVLTRIDFHPSALNSEHWLPTMTKLSLTVLITSIPCETADRKRSVNYTLSRSADSQTVLLQRGRWDQPARTPFCLLFLLVLILWRCQTSSLHRGIMWMVSSFEGFSADTEQQGSQSPLYVCQAENSPHIISGWCVNVVLPSASQQMILLTTLYSGKAATLLTAANIW